MDNIYFLIKNKYPLSLYEEDFILSNKDNIVFVNYDNNSNNSDLFKKVYKINPTMITKEEFLKLSKVNLFYNDIAYYIENIDNITLKNFNIINKDVYFNNWNNFITNEKLILNSSIIKKNIYNKIKKKYLDLYRFYHALSVGFISYKIGFFQKEINDKESLFLAGIIHDIAKDIDMNKQKELASKNKFYIESKDYVLRQFAGAELYSKLINKIDTNIYSSISFHCTGKKDMNLFEKIIFLSDKYDPLRYISDKNKHSNKIKILHDSYLHFSHSFEYLTLDQVSYFKSKNYDINENFYSKEFYNFYLKK